MPVCHARAAISTPAADSELALDVSASGQPRARARYRRACGVGERRGHDVSVPEAPMTIIGLGSPCRSAARASSGGWTDGSRLARSTAPATAQQPCPPSTGARLILVILPPCRSERHPTLPPVGRGCGPCEGKVWALCVTGGRLFLHPPSSDRGDERAFPARTVRPGPGPPTALPSGEPVRRMSWRGCELQPRWSSKVARIGWSEVGWS